MERRREMLWGGGQKMSKFYILATRKEGSRNQRVFRQIGLRFWSGVGFLPPLWVALTTSSFCIDIIVREGKSGK